MWWLTNSVVRSHLPLRPLMQLGLCTASIDVALSRPKFQAALTERAAKREQHTQRVRQQHVTVLDDELARRRALSARSVRRSAAVVQAREEAAQVAAMHDRARPWMTLVDMCWRLSVIQVCPGVPVQIRLRPLLSLSPPPAATLSAAQGVELLFTPPVIVMNDTRDWRAINSFGRGHHKTCRMPSCWAASSAGMSGGGSMLRH